jgi:hypothetical protein
LRRLTYSEHLKQLYAEAPLIDSVSWKALAFSENNAMSFKLI